MKHAWVLFGLMVALLGVFTAVMLTDEPEQSHGFEHPTYQAMDKGGSDSERHGQLLGLAWLLGVLEVALFVCLMALGARRREGLGKMRWQFLLGGLIYVGVFSVLVLAYHRYLHEAETTYIGPFPAPTAVMLFGLWPMPLYFAVLYVVYFDRWILTPEDVEKFRQLVAARRGREEDRN